MREYGTSGRSAPGSLLHFMPDIPEEWLNTYAALRRTALCKEIPLPKYPRKISLSYSRPMRKRLEKDGLKLEDMARDLSQGFSLKKEITRNPNDHLYRLTGSKFTLLAAPAIGDTSQEPMARVVEARRIDRPLLADQTITSQVEFSLVWKEGRCDLPSLQESLDRHHALVLGRKNERDGLIREMTKQTAHPSQDPHGQLRAKAHKSYDTLKALLRLLKLKIQTEQQACAQGVVLETGGDEPAAVPRGEDGNEAYTVIRIISRSGEFEEDDRVEIVRSKDRNTAKTKIKYLNDERDQFSLLPQDRVLLAPGEEVEIHADPWFGMQAHSNALDAFLKEQVEGDWGDLSRLICQPETLEWKPKRSRLKFFCDCESDPRTPRLNEEQRAAVAAALSTPHAFFIQGPPGTGKTSVIVELIRHLATRGEKVLLLAPTHVAVDEVLERVGDKPRIRPLRLSWDDRKVRPNLQRFMYSGVIREMVRRLRQAENDDRRQEQTISDARELTAIHRRRIRIGQDFLAANAQAAARERELNAQIRRFDEKRSALEKEIAGDRQTAASLPDELQKAETAAEKAEAAYKRKSGQVTGLIARALGTLGNLGSLRREMSSQKRKLTAIHKQIAAVDKAWRAAEKKLAELLATEPPKIESLKQQHAEAAEDAQRLAAEWDKENPSNGEPPNKSVLQKLEAAAQAAEACAAEGAARSKLRRRWKEILAGASEDELIEELGQALIRSVNLICCTTTGIASGIARDLSFDTMIIDEASRVTDGEFLIGAVRARRWILIGDEHQLPPYVEQENEHFLHALAALHRVERGASSDLADAVERLAEIWEEDEELHRFRKDAVSGIAQQLRDRGQWSSAYREPYNQTFHYCSAAGENPDRVFLGTMHDHLIQSVFDRCVLHVQPALKQKLVIQRRMIRPMAEIVREPIYGGDYQSPSDKDLAGHGVTPLAVPPFKPITFIDTTQRGKQARETLVGSGFTNDYECRAIVDACQTFEEFLRQGDGKPVTVSILAFYRAQSRAIQQRLGESDRSGHYPGFRVLQFRVIDAIDKIQGQESDLVFLSFCRAKIDGHVGPGFGWWLRDLHRLNVACTRAHRALVMVGHRRTLEDLTFGESPHFYRRLFQLLEDKRNCDCMTIFRRGYQRPKVKP